MLRTEEAIEFLLSIIADEPRGSAQDAVAALEMYRSEEKLWKRVVSLIDSRSDIDSV